MALPGPIGLRTRNKSELVARMSALSRRGLATGRGAMRTGLGGLLFGFAVCGPLLWVGFVLAQSTRLAQLTPAGEVRVRSPGSLSDYSLVRQVKSSKREKGVLLAGSSEFRGAPSVPEILEGKRKPLDAVPATKTPPRFFSIGYGGSALWRTVLTLERLQSLGIEPGPIAIVVNPYYAWSTAQPADQQLGAIFPDASSARLHICRMMANDPAYHLRNALAKVSFNPPHKASDNCNHLWQTKADMFRHVLSREVAAPFTRLMNNGVLPSFWRDSQASNAKVQMKTPEQQSPSDHTGAATQPGAAPAELDLSTNGSYGQSLLRLRALAKDRDLLLLLLPLNPEAYREKEAPRLQNEWLMATKHLYGAPDNVILLLPMQNQRLFSDRVHYTPKGRQLLAHTLRQKTKAWLARIRVDSRSEH